GCIQTGGEISELDAHEDVTLVDVDTVVGMDADTQGRMKEDVTAVKEVNACEPIVFDDEEKLIKMKAKKARLLDEQMAKRLHDEEVKQAAVGKSRKKMIWRKLKCYNSTEKQRIPDEQMAKRLQDKEIEQAAARERQEKKDLERAKVQPIFKREYNYVQTFLKSDRDEEPTKKRAAKETLLQESFKKLKAEVKASCSSSTQQDTLTIDPTEISEEDVLNMLQIILTAKFKVEALQVKYPLIDWEIYSE
nr:hypothetical protein [Tanacetum cinerariifolium]